MSFSFQEFKTRFPEFDSIDQDYYNAVKSSAVLEVNPNVWKLKTDEGVKLMTAHLLTIGARGGTSGTVISEKVGDLERKYSDNSVTAGTGSLSSTTYGLEFERVTRTLVTSPLIV